jgi:hypothetical protein
MTKDAAQTQQNTAPHKSENTGKHTAAVNKEATAANALATPTSSQERCRFMQKYGQNQVWEPQ